MRVSNFKRYIALNINNKEIQEECTIDTAYRIYKELKRQGSDIDRASDIKELLLDRFISHNEDKVVFMMNPISGGAIYNNYFYIEESRYDLTFMFKINNMTELDKELTRFIVGEKNINIYKMFKMLPILQEEIKIDRFKAKIIGDILLEIHCSYRSRQ